MTSKKGELKEVDAREQMIRDNPLKHSAVLYRPRFPVRQDFDTFDEAMAFISTGMREGVEYRSALIYAIGDLERTALVGTMDRNLNWKPVVPKRHK